MIVGVVVAVAICLVLAISSFLIFRLVNRRRYKYNKLEDNPKLEFKSLMQDRSPTQNQKIKSGFMDVSSSSGSNKSASKVRKSEIIIYNV